MGHLAFLGIALRQRRLGAAYRAACARPCSTIFGRRPTRIVNKTNGITFRRWLLRGQSGADRAAGQTRSASACSTIRRCLRGTRAARRATRISSRDIASSARTTRRALAECICAADRRRGRSAARCSTCTSSASMNTSGNCSTSWRRVALYQAIRAQPARATGCRG